MTTQLEYFAGHKELYEHRKRDMVWVRESIGKLRKMADGFESRTAFVLGTGPSLYRVKSEQWAAMEGVFSIGVNHFARYAIQDIQTNMFPHLLMVTDVFHGKSLEYFKELFACHNSPVISAYTPGAQELPSDYRVPYCACDLHTDLEFGLSISPMLVKFNRSCWAAAHLACLLGFKRVALLGVDHQESYQQGDSIRASHSFGYMREWAANHLGCELVQAGTDAAFDTVPYVPLDEILCTAGVPA